MSLSNEWALWHLTPRGWEQGDYKHDFHPSVEVPAPPDRVATYYYEEFLGAMGGSWHRSADLSWVSDDKRTFDALLKRFGPCPQKL